MEIYAAKQGTVAEFNSTLSRDIHNHFMKIAQKTDGKISFPEDIMHLKCETETPEIVTSIENGIRVMWDAEADSMHDSCVISKEIKQEYLVDKVENLAKYALHKVKKI